MKYEVTIQATITKTYTIDAPNEDEAIQAANDDFDVNTIEHTYENYEQDTIDVQLIEEQTS
jgi:alpha/beta superfamily hydrolase